jgi:polyisoprenoid-binding protein YceI
MQPTSTSLNDSTEPRAKSHEWTIDATHSHVGFSVRHLMIANVRGEFTKLSGSVTWDPARPDATKIDVEIDVASVNTREEKRDAHLRSAYFFDAEQFPKITYHSRGVGRHKGDGHIEVVGDLTIHGVSRVVVLDVEGPTPEQSDPWGNTRIAATARTVIKRSDFGMTWNSALEAGGVLVGDDIKIELEVELTRNK